MEGASIAGHKGDVWSVAFTADSAALLSGDGDWNQPGQVKLWDATTGQPLADWETSGEVLSVAVSADSRTIAAGTWDKKVHPFRQEHEHRNADAKAGEHDVESKRERHLQARGGQVRRIGLCEEQ